MSVLRDSLCHSRTTWTARSQRRRTCQLAPATQAVSTKPALVRPRQPEDRHWRRVDGHSPGRQRRSWPTDGSSKSWPTTVDNWKPRRERTSWNCPRSARKRPPPSMRPSARPPPTNTGRRRYRKWIAAWRRRRLRRRRRRRSAALRGTSWTRPTWRHKWLHHRHRSACSAVRPLCRHPSVLLGHMTSGNNWRRTRDYVRSAAGIRWSDKRACADYRLVNWSEVRFYHWSLSELFFKYLLWRWIGV